MNSVLLSSNVAPTFLAHSRARGIMLLCIFWLFSSIDFPTTHEEKSSAKQMAPESLVIAWSARAALKIMYRIGEHGEPCGIPGCANTSASDVKDPTHTDAFLSEQKSKVQFIN